MATVQDMKHLHPSPPERQKFWAWAKEQFESRTRSKAQLSHSLYIIANSLDRMSQAVHYDFRDNERKLVIWDKSYVSKRS